MEDDIEIVDVRNIEVRRIEPRGKLEVQDLGLDVSLPEQKLIAAVLAQAILDATWEPTPGTDILGHRVHYRDKMEAIEFIESDALLDYLSHLDQDIDFATQKIRETVAKFNVEKPPRLTKRIRKYKRK